MFHEAMMIYDAILSAVKENYRTSFGINTDGCCTIVDHSNAVNEVNTPYPVKEHVLPLFPLPLFPICLKEYCIEPNPFSNPLKIFPINQKTNRKKFSDDNNITISNESGKVGSKDQNRIASMSTIASSFSGGADVNLLELLLQSYSNAATVYGVLDDFRTASDLYKEAFHLARSKLGESHDYTNDLNALYMRANEW